MVTAAVAMSIAMASQAWHAVKRIELSDHALQRDHELELKLLDHELYRDIESGKLQRLK